MSNEELERIMNFIIERQEYASEQIARLTESQNRFDEAQAVLSEQQSRLVEQQSRLVEQQSDHEERIARFERSYVAIAQLLGKHDDQIEALTKGLNDLTTLVTRYITARGDGGNGGAQK